jgi:ABC-type dipeptide/oligopeptide/nickel transport system permease component
LSFRRFLLVRLGWAVLALWIAVTVVFVTTRVISLRAEDFRNPGQRFETYRAFVRDLRLDEPIHERYAHFLRDSAEQDFGHSATKRRSSRAIVFQAVPATLSLVLPALGLAVLVGLAVAIPLSRASSRRRYLWRIPVGVAVGIPPLLLGLWLSYYVGFKAGWLPITGYCDFFDPPKGLGCGGAVDWAEHLVLAWIALGLFFAAIYARVLRVWLREIAAASPENRPRLARRARGATARLVGRDFGLPSASRPSSKESSRFLGSGAPSSLPSIRATSASQRQSWCMPPSSQSASIASST